MNYGSIVILDTQGNMREINLSQFRKPVLQLGRHPELCEIVLGDNVVSKVHGCFKLENDKVYYQDLKSSNGTFLEQFGQSKLLHQTSTWEYIADKTVLRIGNVDDPDKMVLLLYNESGQNEKWERLMLTMPVIGMGRGLQNQIVLKHPGVSRVHCHIKKSDGKSVLYAEKDTNGVYVNGEKVETTRVLNDKDIIQILDYRIIFAKTCIYYRTQVEGIRLEACKVNKEVGRGSKRKKILNDVNCLINGNEFVAIIGGSGAGKSTLMNAISGFDQKFSGKVYCNGMDLLAQFSHLKNLIGYVPQEDIIYENLTLHKMLYYTAKMKMPKDTDAVEIKNRISEVLGMVNLKEHEKTFIRKLSGGQKKRASIAVELLADPKLFFLDEPTSGLDPGTEKTLMETLSLLAKTKNKTIIMVTHTTQNLHLCDKIVFMGPGGRLCFCGGINEAKRFFETEDLVNIYNVIAENPEFWQKKFDAQMQSQQETGRIKAKVTKNTGRRSTVSIFTQFMVLVKRYVEIMKNDLPRLLVLMLQPLLIGILLYIVADKDVFKIYESTKSMLFALSCSGIWIGLFNSIQEICKERVILKREYMANLKLPCYILSKFVVQAVLGLVQSTILTMVFLELAGADKKGIFLSHFRWEILLTIWLTVLAATTMGFVISSLVKTGDKAMAVAPFVLIIQLLFSGILFKLEGAGEIISYCTISRWSVEGLGGIAKLNALDLRLQEEFPMLEHAAESFFESSKGHLQEVWMILAGMIILCMAVSMISLRKVAKDGR